MATFHEIWAAVLTIVAVLKGTLDSASLLVAASVHASTASLGVARKGADGAHGCVLGRLDGHGLAHDGAAVGKHLQLGHGAAAGRGRDRSDGLGASRSRHGAQGSRRGRLEEGAHGLGLTKNAIHCCLSGGFEIGVLFVRGRVGRRGQLGFGASPCAVAQCTRVDLEQRDKKKKVRMQKRDSTSESDFCGCKKRKETKQKPKGGACSACPSHLGQRWPEKPAAKMAPACPVHRLPTP